MSKDEYFEMIKCQAFDLATAEADKRKARRMEQSGSSLRITPFSIGEPPAPRVLSGERAWAELASTILDHKAWLSIAEHLESNIDGLSGTSWLEGRFDGLQLKCGFRIVK